eukprot:TRINITY_DN93657_c0_g1_i1.p1 TRINITY_DN93657_c0_g1~~TRINITY_DN93657_c0_g1_i1.p1  ORF type:complete len:346 (-),score=30.59 TRINITY_DN93657_c0_g1_i1:170-1060(-)
MPVQPASDAAMEGNELPAAKPSHTQASNISSTFLGEVCDVGVPGDSDHNTLLFKFTVDQTPRELLVVSWNIAFQYGYNAQRGYYNNGYGIRNESNDEYISRLRRISKQVRTHAEMYEPQAIFLQECADSYKFGFGELAKEAKRHLGGLGYHIHSDGEFLTAVKASSVVVQLPALERQQGKLYVVYSEALDAVFVNVHLLWDRQGSESEKKSREAVETVLSHLRTEYPDAAILLAGDTNRVPGALPRADKDAATIEQLVDGLGELCHPPGPTNVRWNDEVGTSEMTYADFALLAPLP